MASQSGETAKRSKALKRPGLLDHVPRGLYHPHCAPVTAPARGVITQCAPNSMSRHLHRVYANPRSRPERPRMSQAESNATPAGLDETNDQILRDGANYTDRPKEARAWIESFGSFAPGTKVSRRLLTSGSTSLLPILASWLAKWFQRTQTARKQARLSIVQDDREKMMSMQYEGANHVEDIANAEAEESNLRWLFDYLFDYLSLGQDHPPSSDLQDVCQTVIKLCQSTTSIEDIEASIRVISGVLGNWSLPQDTVYELLDILCNTRMTLSRNIPPHLMDCITSLVQGEHSNATKRRLLDFIQNANISKSTKKSVALARGSVLFLQDFVGSQNEKLKALFDFTDLIISLQAASKIEAVRLCTDILDLCSQLSRETHTLATVLPEFRPFMNIVEECALIGKAKASLRLSPDSTDDHNIIIDEQDPYQVANINSESNIKSSLLEIWHNGGLTENNRLLIYQFFVNTLDNTKDDQLKLMLLYAQNQKLCYFDQAQGQTERSRIIQNFVHNSKMSNDLRNLAIRIVNDAEMVNIGSGSSEVVDSWLEQFEIEEDLEVSNALAQCLQTNALHASDATYSQKIVDGLEDIVFRQDRSREVAPAVAGAVTILINLTLQSITPNVAFNVLLKTANIECKAIEARTEAMRFLFRIRCDSNGAIYLQDHADSQYIAAALCRTRDSWNSFTVIDTEPQRKSSSSTSLSTRSNSTPSGWIYPDTEEYDVSRKFTNEVVVLGRRNVASSDAPALDMGAWLITIAECLQRDLEWETYSYLITHTGAQLSNTTLFTGSDKLLETISVLRRILCERIVTGKIFKPPASTGLKESDVAICLFNVLTGLIPYATIKAGPIQKGYADDLVKAFLAGIGGTWEGTSRSCMHALSICCLEMPASVASYYPTIVDKMSKNMTQAHLSMHILEFLAQVARLPAVHSNFQDDEIMMIFSICIQFLERARERPTTTHLTSSGPRSSTPAARQSGLSSRRPPYRARMLVDLGLSHYNSALVYHVMIFWFLSLKLSLRARSVKWIIPRLVWKDRQGEEQVDELSMVFIDMMQRTAYSDLGETASHPQFATAGDGRISSASWVVGSSIVSVETAGHTGITQITKRQASGTTHAVYQQYTAPMPSHHVPVNTGIRIDDDPAGVIEQLPSHVLLQMAATADPVALRSQPVLLPKDDTTRRAIESFDRLVTVDSHKLGILYIGPGQSLERDYLANTSGSSDYDTFLEGLGTCVSLNPPLRYNPQGLQNGIDGTKTYAWRDRVTEIVYHIPTMMPTNLADDPGSTQKKSHVGNCHVNIIYNRSGQAWNFANFSSQLNYVNIVVEPANRISSSSSAAEPSLAPSSSSSIDFFRVQTLTAPQFPAISPASDFKVLSAAQLPQFVRMLSLNANVFCQAWNVRDSDTEFPSSWRARLQAIKRLREKVVSKETGTLAQQLDFSSFTLS